MTKNIDELEQFGIPDALLEVFKTSGCKTLTEVQAKAVEAGLFEGESLAISAPTNTGKTFIAELAIINASIKGKRSFYLVPLKSIAEEKFEEFTLKYSDFGLKIAITTADRTEFDEDLLNHDLVIATFEKMLSLIVNKQEIVNELGLIVVDEVQVMGDPNRGFNLEVLLTYLKLLEKSPQLIALSATIPNAEEIAMWLNAKLVKTERRDVELREGVKYIGKNPISFRGINLEKGDFVFKEFNSKKIGVERSLDFNELIKDQTIIFCETQGESQKLAKVVSRRFKPIDNIVKWIEKLEDVEETSYSKDLKNCITKGVAFHHAGMLPEERKIVEEAFRSGDLRIICCTPTLGAGVNTPAKNVIIRPYRYPTGNLISVAEYKNRAGRAGRFGYHDDFGRSILYASSLKDLEMLWNKYITAKPEEVNSRFDFNKLDFLSLLLTVLGFNSIEDMARFMRNTFFGFKELKDETKITEVSDVLIRIIGELERDGFVTTANGKIVATELGRKCISELLLPKSAKTIYNALKIVESKGSDLKDLTNFEEVIIQLACSTNDARNYLLYAPRRRSQDEKETLIYYEANKERYLVDIKDPESILRVTKTTQMLLRWIEGSTFSEIRRFAPDGIVKRTAEGVSWIVGAIAKIADKPLFNFSQESIQRIIKLSEQLIYGVPENAVNIMRLRIPAVHRQKAIALAESGYVDIESLINADIPELEKVRTIGNKTAVKIKKFVSKFIKDKDKKIKELQKLRAVKLGRDSTIIERIYNSKSDEFSRVVAEVINDQFGIPCQFIGDIDPHEPDCLIEIPEGKIVVECKTTRSLVSAKEAEEILGKGAKYNPLANVTIGNPDFCEEAIKNTEHTKITLISAKTFAELLLQFWEGKINRNDVLNILKLGNYIDYL